MALAQRGFHYFSRFLGRVKAEIMGGGYSLSVLQSNIGFYLYKEQ